MRQLLEIGETVVSAITFRECVYIFGSEGTVIRMRIDLMHDDVIFDKV